MKRLAQGEYESLKTADYISMCQAANRWCSRDRLTNGDWEDWTNPLRREVGIVQVMNKINPIH